MKIQTSSNMLMVKNLFACAICPESFSTSSALVHHVQMKHNVIETSKTKTDHKSKDQNRKSSFNEYLEKHSACSFAKMSLILDEKFWPISKWLHFCNHLEPPPNIVVYLYQS